jgi:hypothetical protein
MTSSAKRHDAVDTGFLLLSLAATLTTLSVAVVSTIVAISDSLQGRAQPAGLERWISVAMAFLSLIGFYAIYHSGRRLFQQVRPDFSRPTRLSLLTLIAFPIGLLMVYLGYERGILPGLLIPLGHLMTTVTPVLAAALTARWLGPLISRRRALGQFLLGVWAAPLMALALEGAALLPISLFIGLGVSADPRGMRLLESLQGSTSIPFNIPGDLLTQVFLQPWILLMAVMFLSVIVPLIEEAIKTVGIWPLIGRTITPGEAFLSGALSGSGYALFEALLLTQPGESWLPLLVARGGASLMHAFTGAIGTWGVTQGIYRRKWASMALGFFGAVAVHGLWNVAATGISLGEILASPEPWNPWREGTGYLTNFSMTVVAGLVCLAVLGLIGISLRLRAPGDAQDPSI